MMLGIAHAPSFSDSIINFPDKSIAVEALKNLGDRKSTRLNSSHLVISYAVFCLKKKKTEDVRLAAETFRGARQASGGLLLPVPDPSQLAVAVQPRLLDRIPGRLLPEAAACAELD